MAELKWGTGRNCGVFRAEPRPRLSFPAPLPFPAHSSPAIFFPTAGSAARPSWARAAFAYLPLLLLPGRIQQQVPVPVVLLLHVGLCPADCRLVVGSVIIYHVSKRNLSAPQGNYRGWKRTKIRREKNDNGPKQRDGTGKVRDPGKWSSFLAAFSSKWAPKVRNIRRVQPQNPPLVLWEEKLSLRTGRLLGGTGRSYTLLDTTRCSLREHLFPVWLFIVISMNYNARQFNDINSHQWQILFLIPVKSYVFTLWFAFSCSVVQVGKLQRPTLTYVVLFWRTLFYVAVWFCVTPY